MNRLSGVHCLKRKLDPTIVYVGTMAAAMQLVSTTLRRLRKTG